MNKAILTNQGWIVAETDTHNNIKKDFFIPRHYGKGQSLVVNLPNVILPIKFKNKHVIVKFEIDDLEYPDEKAVEALYRKTIVRKQL